jgi:hypothetical protein
MPSSAMKLPAVPNSAAPATSVEGGGVQLARYAGLDTLRRPLVWAGEGAGEAPRIARWVSGLSAGTPVGSAVLLQWLGGSELPLILGVVKDTVPPDEASTQAADDKAGMPVAAIADGKRLLFEAKQEVVLRCGEASVTLLANGRVVIKGSELVSRARGANKIRGATVSIN